MKSPLLSPGARRARRLSLLLAALLTAASAGSGSARAEDPNEGAFTSSPAITAHDRYALLLGQARAQMVAELKAALKETMQAGQLDEANRIAKIIDAQGSGASEPLTSVHGKAAQSRYQAVAQRVVQDYVANLKGALAASLHAGQLEESNRISAEIKKLSGPSVPKADPVSGFIDMMPSIDPAKDTVVGTWTMEKGALVNSGNDKERIEIPYRPPAEYDFRISFTKTGNNLVIQNLTELGTPFMWLMGTGDAFSFHYIRGAGIWANKTTVHRPPGLQDGHLYTSLVRVRKNGAETSLDGRPITRWETNYGDVEFQDFWALRDKTVLGLSTGGAKTIFHTVEVKEVSGPGAFTRP